MTKRMPTSQRSEISLGIATMGASLLGTWTRGKADLVDVPARMCLGLELLLMPVVGVYLNGQQIVIQYVTCTSCVCMCVVCMCVF